MNADQDYGFDVAGFLHVPQVLSAAEVAACNEALDAVGRDEGMLEWPAPHGEPFQALREHPVLSGFLESLCSAGFAIDKPPALLGDGNATGPVPLSAGAHERRRRLRYANYSDTRVSKGVRVFLALAPTPESGGGRTGSGQPQSIPGTAG